VESMNQERSRFSICIPAYNRARHLEALLDSIFAQDYRNFEVVICEDSSPERGSIAAIVQRYSDHYPDTIRYYENTRNLGYDANIRNLVARAKGEFCFFMGNDDLMCSGALAHVDDILRRHNNVGVVLKSYAWFDHIPKAINQEIRYFKGERVFAPGREAISICFRRSGVISGYIVDRDAAHDSATDAFDGTLYYQMHLTASVLSWKCAVSTPHILVLCRNGEPPDFGNSSSETGKYLPGVYTPEARLNMIAGALSIIRHHDRINRCALAGDVMQDYANYFYPYIKDQLSLSPSRFLQLYYKFARIGFYKYPMFHLYFLMAYLLGERRCDRVTAKIRGYLGRSPQFGIK
jgi:abequosyltransferase